MTFYDSFVEGGWGMYPTLVFGLVLLAVAVRYAVEPSRRFVPLLLTVGIVTLSSGALGFATGVIRSIRYAARPDLANPFIPLVGVGESLNNVAFSLVFVTLAACVTAVGAWKLSRQAKPGVAAA